MTTFYGKPLKGKVKRKSKRKEKKQKKTKKTKKTGGSGRKRKKGKGRKGGTMSKFAHPGKNSYRCHCKKIRAMIQKKISFVETPSPRSLTEVLFLDPNATKNMTYCSWDARQPIAIPVAGCLDLSSSTSLQFTLKCTPQQKTKKITKISYFEGSWSFKITNVDTL